MNALILYGPIIFFVAHPGVPEEVVAAVESLRWKCCSRLSSLWVRSAEHGRSAKNRGKTINTTATATSFAVVMGDLAVMMIFGVFLSEREDAAAALL